MFGLGVQEILVLLILGVLLIGMPLGVVFVVLYVLRRKRGENDPR